MLTTHIHHPGALCCYLHRGCILSMHLAVGHLSGGRECMLFIKPVLGFISGGTVAL